jgi:hypothetical protein
MSSDEGSPGVEGPDRVTQYVFKATSELPWFFSIELSRLEYVLPIAKTANR